MWDVKSWEEAADWEANRALEQGGYTSGAVDAIQLARNIGCDVIFDHHQSNRGRLKRLGKRCVIFLKPDQRPERIQWAASHEIGETLAFRVFRRLGVDPTEGEPGLREHVANLLASRLLLPGHTFFPEADSVCESLFRLKEIFSTASHELIAMRLLDRPGEKCVTVVDQGRVTKRRTSNSSCPRNLLPSEKQCWERTHSQCCYQEYEDETYRIRCWPIHEEHWKREIVFTSLKCQI